MYAIVTGSSSGLGDSISRYLLDRDYTVFGGSRSPSEIEHPQFIDIELDVSQEDSVELFYEEIAKSTDEIHLFINNAGICEMSSLGETESEDFMKHFQVNTLGVFHMLKYLEDFLVQDETHIVTILSTAAKYAYPNVGGYVSSKFALQGLIETCKQEWKDYEVRFSNFYPGAIDTPLWQKIGLEFGQDKMLTVDEFMDVFSMVVESSPAIQFPDITFLHKNGYLS